MRLFKSMVPGVQAAASLLAIGLVVGVWSLATRRQPASPPVEVAGGVTHQIGKIWQGEVVSQKFRLQTLSPDPYVAPRPFIFTPAIAAFKKLRIRCKVIPTVTVCIGKRPMLQNVAGVALYM
jgi:hypothetical protein